MVGVPDPGLFLSTADLYAEVAEDLGVPLESDIVPELLGDNRFKADAVHPNAAGYTKLAEAIHELLRKTGRCRSPQRPICARVRGKD